MTDCLNNVRETYILPAWTMVKEMSSQVLEGESVYPTETLEKVIAVAALLAAYGSINSSLGSFDKILFKGVLFTLPIYGILDGLNVNVNILNLIKRVGSIASVYCFNAALNSPSAYFLTKFFIGGYLSALTLGPQLPERIMAIGVLGYNAFNVFKELPFAKVTPYFSKPPVVTKLPIIPFNATAPIPRSSPFLPISTLIDKPVVAKKMVALISPPPKVPLITAPPVLQEKILPLMPTPVMEVLLPSSIANVTKRVVSSTLNPISNVTKKVVALPSPLTNLTKKVVSLTPNPISTPVELNAPPSSSLLPLLAGIAVVCVVGYGALKLYQRYKAPLPKKEVPTEFQEAVAIYNDKNRNLVSRYILSSIGFSKSAVYNIARTIKHIVFALLGIIKFQSEERKINFTKASSYFREARVSSLGIIYPPLVAGA